MLPLAHQLLWFLLTGWLRGPTPCRLKPKEGPMTHETLSDEGIAAAEQLARKLEKYSPMLVGHALLINWRKTHGRAKGVAYYQRTDRPHGFEMMISYALPPQPRQPTQRKHGKAI